MPTKKNSASPASKSAKRPTAARNAAPARRAGARGAAAPAASAAADPGLVDAKTAAALLGVKPQTLYAYVSRGLIRTAPRRGTKESLYHREDLETVKLKGRRGAPSGPPAERFLRWGGSAVLHTSITALGPHGPSYRGHLATDLAASKGFEDCVELLWGGLLPAQPAVWRPAQVLPSLQPFMAALAKVAPQNSSRRLMALTAEAYTACTGRNAELALGAPVLAARQLIQVLAPVFGLLGPAPRYGVATGEEPIALSVARSAGIDTSAEVLHALNACLVLCADHELAPSTFAARIAASAGADIFSCVNSALGAFEGLLTGMGCDQAEAVFSRTGSVKAYIAELKDLQQRKLPISGYGHPLYPGGDPRARMLIELARDLTGRRSAGKAVLAGIDAVRDELGLLPNLAMGLMAMSASLGLPQHSPGALMALGRTAGWVSHAFEQRLAGFLVRPRARYVGPPPAA